MNEPKRRPGRPQALSADVQAKLIEGIRAGLFLTTACRLAGITPSCFYHWRRKARNGESEAVEYQEFFHTIKRASALAELDAIRSVRSAVDDSWKAPAWFLARRFPERWGRG